jgi:DNA-binding XRE family transcriptional regulator
MARNVGITRPYLSDIENCKRQVSGEVMIRIARFLNVNVEKIFFVDDVHHGVHKQEEN